MTFRIEQGFGQWASGAHRYYKEGERVRANIGAWGGLSSRPTILVSLASGEGFIAGDKVYRPGEWCWTSLGNAVAK